MDNLYEWFHDDITWCGNECSNTECERNMANRLQKTGLFSAAPFKGTEICPLYKGKELLSETACDQQASETSEHVVNEVHTKQANNKRKEGE